MGANGMNFMKRILTTADVAERYKCSLQCARNYIRRMPHMEKPLGVYETDLEQWELERMVIPRRRANRWT